MKLIEFGRVLLYIIYPLLQPLVWTGRLLLNSSLSLKSKVNSFILTFFSFLPNICFRFLYLLELRFKKQKIELIANQLKTKKKLFTLESYTIQSNKYFPYILLLINSLCESVFVTGFFFIKSSVDDNIIFFEMNVTLIFISAITTKFVLNYPLHRHQIVSIVIVSINLVLIFIQQSFLVDPSNNKIEENIVFFFIFVGFYILVILDIIQKFLMEKRYYSLFKIIFVQSSYSSIIYLFLLLVIFPLIKCNGDYCYYDSYGYIAQSMSTLFDTLLNERVFYFILYLVFFGGYMFCLLSTSKHFTPTHRCFSETLGEFIYWIIELIRSASESKENKSSKFNVFVFVRFIMLLLSSLIYNDLIILNFWGLGLNTRKILLKESYLKLLN